MSPSARQTREPGVGLSRRQRQMVLLRAHGLTNAEIAEDLGISERTVKNTLTNAHHRLGLHGRARPGYLVAYMVGLLDAGLPRPEVDRRMAALARAPPGRPQPSTETKAGE